MSKIKLTLPGLEIPTNGKQVTFVAPCSCLETEALQIDGVDYTVVDSFCKCVTGVGGRWVAGAVVSVILDTENRRAYLQNDTSGVSAKVTEAYGLEAEATVDDAFCKVPELIARVGDIKHSVRTDLDNKWALCNGDIVDAKDTPELFYSNANNLSKYTRALSADNTTTITRNYQIPAISGWFQYGAIIYAGGYYAMPVTNSSEKMYGVYYATDPMGAWTLKRIGSAPGNNADSYHDYEMCLSYCSGRWFLTHRYYSTSNRVGMFTASDLNGEWTHTELTDTSYYLLYKVGCVYESTDYYMTYYNVMSSGSKTSQKHVVCYIDKQTLSVVSRITVFTGANDDALSSEYSAYGASMIDNKLYMSVYRQESGFQVICATNEKTSSVVLKAGVPMVSYYGCTNVIKYNNKYLFVWMESNNSSSHSSSYSVTANVYASNDGVSFARVNSFSYSGMGFGYTRFFVIDGQLYLSINGYLRQFDTETYSMGASVYNGYVEFKDAETYSRNAGGLFMTITPEYLRFFTQARNEFNSFWARFSTEKRDAVALPTISIANAYTYIKIKE